MTHDGPPDIDPTLPPHSLEAEQAVLGAILYDPDALVQIVDVLKPEDFYRHPHQHIFWAMIQLFASGEKVDIVFVSEYLSDNERLEAAGGRGYLMDLAMSVATAENVQWYANIIKDKAVLRQLISYGHDTAAHAYRLDSSEAMGYAQIQLQRIALDAEGKAEKSTAEVVSTSLENICARLESNSDMRGIPTGFPELDGILRGLNSTCYCVLAARPGMGKTALALNIARNVAVEQGKPILYFTQEMTPDELMERVLVAEAESEKDIVKLSTAAERIPEHYRIIKKTGMTLAQLRASIIKHQLQYGSIGLVVVDYLQQMSSSARSLYEKTTEISNGLKQLNLEFEVPFLVLSQLSRAVEQRQDKRPMMSDLRESGAIEQDADKAIFIYRDERYNKDSDAKGIAEIIVAKNRNGPEGTVKLGFRSNIVKFINLPTFGNTNGY